LEWGFVVGWGGGAAPPPPPTVRQRWLQV
jgi:hypothetical protein